MNGLSRPRSFRRVATLALGVLLSICVSIVDAAEPIWLKLQSPRFGVISQLDEEDTRKWAVEFDQFIDALQQLFSIDELSLPPLTIVLFARPRAFAPYRAQTESGQPDVSGFFGNMDSWSVIGLAGRRSTVETRRIVYHEAVHWFASADAVQSPLWFEEGIAEVFSTFEAEAGKGHWGIPVEDHVDYLSYVGLQSIDEFLRVSQDEALHGSGRYYPQAWAFIHYLVFGNNGAERSKLQEFLLQLRRTDTDTAFTTAFGKTYKEMTGDLRTYLERGRYSMAQLDVGDRSSEMTVEPATPANVEFALARLAVAGDNNELARRHTDTVIALAPNAAAGYELLGILAMRDNDTAALTQALDKAIELGSQDANVYATRAFRLLEDNRRDGSPVHEMLAVDTARTVADLFRRSIALRPRNRVAYEGFATALLNADVVTEQDDTVLALGRRAFPTDGMVLVGQAAVEQQRGNAIEALRLLGRSRTAPFELPDRYRAAVDSLHAFWLIEWLSTQLANLSSARRFDEAHALLDEQLADPSITGRLRTIIESMKVDFRGFEKLVGATTAARAGRVDEARATLTEVANDPNVSERTRREAQRLLDQIAEQ